MNGIEKKQMTLGELMAAVDAHKAEMAQRSCLHPTMTANCR